MWQQKSITPYILSVLLCIRISTKREMFRKYGGICQSLCQISGRPILCLPRIYVGAFTPMSVCTSRCPPVWIIFYTAVCLFVGWSRCLDPSIAVYARWTECQYLFSAWKKPCCLVFSKSFLSKILTQNVSSLESDSRSWWPLLDKRFWFYRRLD